MKVQIKDFSLKTNESQFDLPEVELNAKFLLCSAPGEQIALMNSAGLKNALIEILKQTIIMKDANPVHPASSQMKKIPESDGDHND